MLFFEVKPPMDAIKLVQSICRDAIDGKVAKKTRHINRLTPMTLIGPATAASIEQIGAKVLAPYFHGEDVKSKKVRHFMFMRQTWTVTSVERWLTTTVRDSHNDPQSYHPQQR